MGKDSKAPFGFKIDGTPKKSPAGRPPGAKNRPKVVVVKKAAKKEANLGTLRAMLRSREAALKLVKDVLRTRLRKELDALA